MDAHGKPTDVFSQWMEFQKSFYEQWLNAASRMNAPWADAMKPGHAGQTTFPGFDLFSQWSEMVRDTIQKASGSAPGGIGPEVLFRILRSSNVFVLFNQFWLEILKDLPRLYEVKWDGAASRQIYDRWVEHYKNVFEQIIGSPVSKTAEEVMASWLNTLQMGHSGFSLMWAPWAKVMPQWQEQMARFLKGDWSALQEGRSLWREVYDETLGRIFRMPAFGLSREHTEQLRRTYDAYLQFWNAVPGFYQFFYKTGLDALQEFFDRLKHFKAEEMTPERLKEIYRIWWTTNENALFDLFKKPAFGNAMGEVLNYGLRLKKRLDELTAEWCKSVSLPSREDYDELAKVVHELRRQVRRQEKIIAALQKRAEPSA
jgi:class III poly(R)-hydroxyalkanoic acid synthase PhaE subunit